MRVTFPDRDDIVSAPLPVIVPGGWARTQPLPKPGETVLCLFLATDRSNGFCLGSYYTEETAPPSGPDESGVWFEDGSYVVYDRSSRELKIKAASGIRVEGGAAVLGSVNIAGNLTVTGTVTATDVREG